MGDTARSYLFIGSYDSMNRPMASLIPALLARGCKVQVVVATLSDAANLYAFEGCGVKPVDVGHFDYACLDEIDVVVMPPVRTFGLTPLMAKVRQREIFTVALATLFSSVVMREYPDLLLCIGQAKFDELKENGLSYNMVAVGNPQYDSLVSGRREPGAPIRRVLVIDQGGYPYGAAGKYELAKTLEAIARFNPEMSFSIKPRFYKQLPGRVTHAQVESLSDFLDEAPDNLSILEKPAQLEDIMRDYDAMITCWSTSYLNAALSGMPLILIGGLDSLDVFDVRTQRVTTAYWHLEGTGCVHHYRELQKGRVDFGNVRPSYLSNEVYGYETPCSERIIDAIERGYQLYTVRQEQWCLPFALTYDKFVSEFDSLPTEPRQSEHAEARHAYLIELNSWLQECVYQNRCLASPLDLSGFQKYFKRSLLEEEIVPEFGFEQAYNRILNKAKQKMRAKFDTYFSKESTQREARYDTVLQDYYFDWLFEKGAYDAIESYEARPVAPASLAYNRARVALAEDQVDKAFEQLQKFLDDVVSPHAHLISKDRRVLKLMTPFMKKRYLKDFMRFAFSHGNFKKLSKLAKQYFGERSVLAILKRMYRLRRA